ncbi:YaaC family protein [Pseudomonas syringae]|uniref:YaaC family protein n=1 Tax=Pseudomonas syringae TaxID=317 RepID=UPI000405AC63|nr:YaaC family protein [Pseudomonas syringae]
MDSWNRLSIYESTDLVRILFKKRHSRELNSGKAREIVSAIAQGREYFEAASGAGILVRPVLQYYGVLALSRGLILLLSPSLRETSLPQSHGLTSTGWGEHLTNNQPGNLSVEVTKGTFLSLMEHTANFEMPWVFTGPYPNRIIIARSFPFTSLLSAQFSFEDVLSRTPELRVNFEKAFLKCASNYRAFLFTKSNCETDIDIFQDTSELPDENTLRTQLAIPDSSELNYSYDHNFTHTNGHFRYRLEHSEGRNSIEMLPQFENNEHTDNSPGDMAIIAPFENGFYISKIGRYFLLAFFLGTLSRYHPTHWLGIMQGRQQGDFIMPIIREVMNRVQNDYCTLIIRELEGPH